MSLDITSLGVRTSAGRELLREVSWSVPTGGRLGIIGESGSGKSLTAQAILGLLPRGMDVTGSVQLDGEELLGRPEKWLRQIRGRRIAMVFQEPLTALDPLMPVGKQIQGPLQLHTELRGAAARTRITQLLDQVALGDHERILRSYPWELSGGQRQRVALAMALACEPDVLIADEPTTALDVTLQDEILTLLAGLIEQSGVTLVFVSHDLPVVARVTDELVVMREGEVVETGPAREVLTAPTSDYARGLVESARSVTALPTLSDTAADEPRPAAGPFEGPHAAAHPTDERRPAEGPADELRPAAPPAEGPRPAAPPSEGHRPDAPPFDRPSDSEETP